MDSYYNRVKDVGEAIAAFVAKPETSPKAQPKNLILQIYICERGRTKSQNRLTTKYRVPQK